MNVAAAVLSGRAHTGLAVRAAACALGLDFVPVGVEEYDLVIRSAMPRTNASSPCWMSSAPRPSARKWPPWAATVWKRPVRSSGNTTAARPG